MDVVKAVVDAKIGEQEYESPVPQDALIQKSNEYASAIAKEISSIFRGVKGIYSRKFP